MSAPRPFLLRFALASLAGLLLCAVAYVGLGWAVCTRVNWVFRAFTFERWSRLDNSYRNACAALLPRDRDGDGICDGTEIYERTDPNNPASGSNLWCNPVDDSVSGEDPRPSYRDLNIRLHQGRTRLLPISPPLPFRARLGGFRSANEPPRGFRLRVTPPPHVEVALPGGPWTAQPLLVPCSPDWTLAFDLRTDATTPLPADDQRRLIIANAATGQVLEEFPIEIVATDPPIPATAKVAAPDDPILTLRRESGPPEPWWRVHWPAAPPGADALILEAARAPDGTVWIPICRYAADETSAVIAQNIYPKGEQYPGPLKFRIIPLHTAPP